MGLARSDRIDLELDKRLAEQSLHEFFIQSWHVTTPGSILCDGWHLEAIAEHLEAVVFGQIKDLLVLVPPRCGKTLLACRSACPRGRGFVKPEHAIPVRFLWAADLKPATSTVDCRRLMRSTLVPSSDGETRWQLRW